MPRMVHSNRVVNFAWSIKTDADVDFVAHDGLDPFGIDQGSIGLHADPCQMISQGLVRPRRHVAEAFGPNQRRLAAMESQADLMLAACA